MTLQHLIDKVKALGLNSDAPLMIFCDNCKLLEKVDSIVPNDKVLQLNMQKGRGPGSKDD
jgi:hypothetical protein